MFRPFRARDGRRSYPGRCPGLYCVAPSGHSTGRLRRWTAVSATISRRRLIVRRRRSAVSLRRRGVGRGTRGSALRRRRVVLRGRLIVAPAIAPAAASCAGNQQNRQEPPGTSHHRTLSFHPPKKGRDNEPAAPGQAEVAAASEMAALERNAADFAGRTLSRRLCGLRRFPVPYPSPPAPW
jgi:hypothetical protein